MEEKQGKVINKKSNRWLQIGVIAVIVVVVAGIFVYKNVTRTGEPQKSTITQDSNRILPRLVELGADTCIPCKQMAPILEELKKEYEGRMIVEVIDVNENREEAMKYNIRVIPTQILFDVEGKEVGRHEGFIAKEVLVKVFEQVGIK